jgi:hypothetical protein
MSGWWVRIGAVMGQFRFIPIIVLAQVLTILFPRCRLFSVEAALRPMFSKPSATPALGINLPEKYFQYQLVGSVDPARSCSFWNAFENRDTCSDHLHPLLRARFHRRIQCTIPWVVL